MFVVMQASSLTLFNFHNLHNILIVAAWENLPSPRASQQLVVFQQAFRLSPHPNFHLVFITSFRSHFIPFLLALDLRAFFLSSC